MATPSPTEQTTLAPNLLAADDAMVRLRQRIAELTEEVERLRNGKRSLEYQCKNYWIEIKRLTLMSPTAPVPAGGLIDEVERLQAIATEVKRILLQVDDDHCWRDAYDKLATLVGITFAPKVLTREQFLGYCGHFHDCLVSGEHYVTPDPTIELKAEIERLQAQLRAGRREYIGPGEGGAC